MQYVWNEYFAWEERHAINTSVTKNTRHQQIKKDDVIEQQTAENALLSYLEHFSKF